MLQRISAFASALLLWTATANAEEPDPSDPNVVRPPPPNLGAPSPATAYPQNLERERHWYDRITLRGYTQFRYNGLFSSNRAIENRQADRYLDNAFSIRRARIILQGDITGFLSVYLQPDFATLVDETTAVAVLRDWYADVFLDPGEKQFRVRVGQSKVPYGWELMQSSGNRLAFDRTDGINSAFVNERDMGVFLFYETPAVRHRLRYLVDSGLKGSGDFGMVAFGVMNGQPLNTRELNPQKHFVARVTYPFDVGSQSFELATAAYGGLTVVRRDEKIAGQRDSQDMRALATAVWYPKPFGLQAEYNIGYGPELVGNRVEKKPLDGGYLMAMYRHVLPWGSVTPYARIHRYDGGKKFETNAPRYEVKQLDAGIEWQYRRWVELTTELMVADRTTNGTQQTGHMLRLQLQFNY